MICEKCGKEHDGSFGSGRFCCRSCANSKTHSEETKKKIQKALKGRILNPSINRTTRYCVECGKKLGIRNKSGYCSNCYPRLAKSEEVKAKQSETMKLRGYPRWHIHRNEPSYAEKFFMNVLKNNNIEYKFDYNIKNNKNHFYILDFFIEKGNTKIDLEIDGKQHDIQDRKNHDNNRDLFLSNTGFIIYRIHWNNINSDYGKTKMKEKIDSFLDFYNSI